MDSVQVLPYLLTGGSGVHGTIITQGQELLAFLHSVQSTGDIMISEDF